jgi:UDP-GlcNAc:undecaprenyl-phosphate GlcNAc-1-phosphate transferase
MNQLFWETLIRVFLYALCFGFLLAPLCIRFSQQLGWLDQPGARKLHRQPVPVTGGILIFLSSLFALLLHPAAHRLVPDYGWLFLAGAGLFAVGYWDDRTDSSPLIRLMIQLISAYLVARTGIRITSLYGLFGIGALNPFEQYALTILILTGATNAFNLLDGINGLAGGMAIINLVLFSLIAYRLQDAALLYWLLALMGATLVFWLYNQHPARMFMGDAGSLMFGFLLPAWGIRLLEQNQVASVLPVSTVLILVFGSMLVPVFDSLRVYAGRIRRGQSPLQADQTHLHHLMLLMGWNHRQAAAAIHLLHLFLMASGVVLIQWLPVTTVMLIQVAFFALACFVLGINRSVLVWTEKIRTMEKASV